MRLKVEYTFRKINVKSNVFFRRIDTRNGCVFSASMARPRPKLNVMAMGRGHWSVVTDPKKCLGRWKTLLRLRSFAAKETARKLHEVSWFSSAFICKEQKKKEVGSIGRWRCFGDNGKISMLISRSRKRHMCEFYFRMLKQLSFQRAELLLALCWWKEGIKTELTDQRHQQIFRPM